MPSRRPSDGRPSAPPAVGRPRGRRRRPRRSRPLRCTPWGTRTTTDSGHDCDELSSAPPNRCARTESPMVLLFWLSCASIAYVYVGYPLLLWVWARLRARPIAVISSDRAPAVSIVVAVRNEGRRLAARLDN